MAIKIGNLAREVMKQLDDYGIVAALIVEKTTEDVAKNAAKTLNKSSPKLTGDYAASWTYTASGNRRNKHSVIVHAEAPEYRLTHLLEKGHQLKKGGRSIGHVKAIEHIAPVEEKAAEQLEKELIKRL